jgi:hypothetical protein
MFSRIAASRPLRNLRIVLAALTKAGRRERLAREIHRSISSWTASGLRSPAKIARNEPGRPRVLVRGQRREPLPGGVERRPRPGELGQRPVLPPTQMLEQREPLSEVFRRTGRQDLEHRIAAGGPVGGRRQRTHLAAALVGLPLERLDRGLDGGDPPLPAAQLLAEAVVLLHDDLEVAGRRVRRAASSSGDGMAAEAGAAPTSSVATRTAGAAQVVNDTLV